MGYRSDVALALTRKGMEQFSLMLESKDTSDLVKEQIPNLLKCANEHYTEEDGSECWYWEQIKWYTHWSDSFADVDFIEKLMNDLDEKDYYFLRIGEEDDDSEIRGTWWDNPFGITFHREIVFTS